MTDTTLAGRTDWETRQWAADHGRTAAAAIGYQLLARHVAAFAAEDAAILGLRELPEPRPQMWPVTGVTDEDGRARVDLWAARHGITAHTDDASGQYRAVLKFGPVTLIAYMIPEQTATERTEAATRRLAALRAAVAAGQEHAA